MLYCLIQMLIAYKYFQRIMFNLFKKKTVEQHIEQRTESVFTELLSTTDFEFTELETIQVFNNVRRKLLEHLNSKKDELIEQSANSHQRAKEIKNALEFLE